MGGIILNPSSIAKNKQISLTIIIKVSLVDIPMCPNILPKS
jgi:hypothetical protein